MTDISDSFDRADSTNLGANWTNNVAGDLAIESNALTNDNASNTRCIAMYNTPLSSVNQYMKGAFTQGGDGNGLMAFRITDTSSPQYVIEFAGPDDIISWYRYTDLGTEGTQIASQARAVNGSGSYGVTVSGTGTSTVVRVWDGVTANTPDSATSWDSRASDITWTTDPASPVDTGNSVGLGMHSGSLSGWFWTDFFAGDVSTNQNAAPSMTGGSSSAGVGAMIARTAPPPPYTQMIVTG